MGIQIARLVSGRKYVLNQFNISTGSVLAATCVSQHQDKSIDVMSQHIGLRDTSACITLWVDNYGRVTTGTYRPHSKKLPKQTPHQLDHGSIPQPQLITRNYSIAKAAATPSMPANRVHKVF